MVRVLQRVELIYLNKYTSKFFSLKEKGIQKFSKNILSKKKILAIKKAVQSNSDT